MHYPNKTFVLDIVKTTNNMFLGTVKQVVVIVAKDAQTAAQHLKEKINFDGVANDLTWLMDTNHPTLYDQTGSKPLDVQAKILYNTVGFMKN